MYLMIILDSKAMDFRLHYMARKTFKIFLFTGLVVFIISFIQAANVSFNFANSFYKTTALVYFNTFIICFLFALLRVACLILIWKLLMMVYIFIKRNDKKFEDKAKMVFDTRKKKDD